MHTSGFAKFWSLVVCGLFFSDGSVQPAFNIQMLGLGQLGSSCPVNWKQSSFVGLGLLISNNDYQVHIDDYMFNKNVPLMIIAQTPTPVSIHINLFNSNKLIFVSQE